ncbi:hypothetical protein I546_1070 [Mycobacterium kansasii 732]|nr:hypothetical protein I546_1070 [Mycobacterium kansasii 732]
MSSRVSMLGGGAIEFLIGMACAEKPRDWLSGYPTVAR